MALEDNEMLDRALDAAEAQMIDSQVEEAPAPTTTDARVEEAVEVQVADQLKAEAKTRDEKTGKFVKGAKATDAAPTQVTDQQEAAEVETAQVEAQGEQPQAAAAIEMPTFWSAELKAAAAKAPKEVVEAFTKYDAQRAQWANRMQAEADRGKALEKQLWSDFESPEEIQNHKAQLQAQGIRSVGEEISRYRAWDKLFRTDVKSGVIALMAKNGLTPYDLLESGGGEEQYQSDPRTEQALQAAEEAKREAAELKAAYQRERARSGEAQIEAFKQAKDPRGVTRAQYFDLYKPQITEAFVTILEQNPHLAEPVALEHAYEYIVGEAIKAHGGVAKPVVAATPVADVKKAKAAASSVTGAPKSGTMTRKPGAKTIDEAMDRAEEKLAHAR